MRSSSASVATSTRSRSRAPRARSVSDAPTDLEWLESLSPWPEVFGLERMHALLATLGEPQRAFRSVHVVGHERQDDDDAACARRSSTRQGSASAPTSRRTCAAGRSGSRSTASPPTSRRRSPVFARTPLGATQFEVLTAAAFAEFAAREVDVAVVEAGLGGRHDATNVLAAPVVVLTNVALDHTDVLGATRERSPPRSSPWSRPARSSCSASPSGSRGACARRGARRGASQRRTSASPSRPRRRTWASGSTRMPRRAAQRPRPARAQERATARDLGRRPQHRRRRLPARSPPATPLHRRGLDPGGQERGRDAGRARDHRRHARRHQSANAACTPADQLALRASVTSLESSRGEPRAALARARELAGPDGAILVTGSLYLLAELSSSEEKP